eukprot:10372253-Heterocapsa_arctica.AAC.1
MDEETEHKDWCDIELSMNEQACEENIEVVETLHAEIDQFRALIVELMKDTSMLLQAVTELDIAVSEATKLRQAEKATNEHINGCRSGIDRLEGVLCEGRRRHCFHSAA